MQNSDTSAFMIATKEKALCDKLVYTKNLQITSLKGLRAYLEEDLRLDMDLLQEYDLEILLSCAECSRKASILEKLHKLIA